MSCNKSSRITYKPNISSYIATLENHRNHAFNVGISILDEIRDRYLQRGLDIQPNYHMNRSMIALGTQSHDLMDTALREAVKNATNHFDNIKQDNNNKQATKTADMIEIMKKNLLMNGSVAEARVAAARLAKTTIGDDSLYNYEVAADAVSVDELASSMAKTVMMPITTRYKYTSIMTLPLLWACKVLDDVVIKEQSMWNTAAVRNMMYYPSELPESIKENKSVTIIVNLIAIYDVVVNNMKANDNDDVIPQTHNVLISPIFKNFLQKGLGILEIANDAAKATTSHADDLESRRITAKEVAGYIDTVKETDNLADSGPVVIRRSFPQTPKLHSFHIGDRFVGGRKKQLQNNRSSKRIKKLLKSKTYRKRKSKTYRKRKSKTYKKY